MMRWLNFRNSVLLLIWAWVLLFVFFPNTLIVGISFLQRHETAFVSTPLSLENYLRLLDPVYLQVLLHSLGIAVIATVVCLLIGYPFAYALRALPPRLKPLLIFLVIIPFWTNSLVRTYAMKLLLATNGLLNQALLGLGIIEVPLRLLYTEAAVIAGLVYVLLPFMILPLYAIFEQLDNTLLEASADLGANRWQTFLRVILPLTLPGIIAGCLLVFLPALGMFYIADVLGGAKNLLLGNIIKNQFLDARDWPFGASLSVMLTVLMGVLLIAYFLSRRFKTTGDDHATLA